MNSEAASYFPAMLMGGPDATTVAGQSSITAGEMPSEIDVQADKRESSIENPISASNLPDESLLRLLQSGNKNALAIVFRRFARLVRAISFRVLRDEAEADDLLQEVFLFIFRKAELFDGTKGSARSWIVQITYHRAIDRRRQLISRHFYDALDLESPTAAALHTEIAFYEQSLEGRLGKEALARIRDSLSEDQRRTLELYFFGGYTIAEIAEQLSQSPGNVRHHYYRALEKMRKLVFSTKLASK